MTEQGNLLQTVSVDFFTKLQDTYKAFKSIHPGSVQTTE